MPPSALNVLSVASEVFPLVKTGGLADVAGALPAALAQEGVHVRTLLPGYPRVMAALGPSRVVAGRDELFGAPVRVLAAEAAGLDLLVLDAPHLFDRPGTPYADAAGIDWPDNPFRFAALARMGADLARDGVEGWQPQIVHGHDWQAGLLPAYMEYDHRQSGQPRPASVFTIHNLAFQGQFPAALFPRLGLPADSFTILGVEYYGHLGYLKSGLLFADRVTTVSPSYATEICLPESGMGLDGLLVGRGDALSGILNGLDQQEWDPAADARLPARFTAADCAPRIANRRALQQRMGLDADDDALIFGVVSRLTWQKGCDLLPGALPALLEHGGQLALVGSGDPAMEIALREAAAAHPGRIACFFGYNEDLAHLLQAGVDALLVPSRFEPCGLTQLSALRYGAVPVVARVGGLADTIIDANPMALAAGVATGVHFGPVTEETLAAAIRRTAALFADKAIWSRIQQNGMQCDVSWHDPARRYAALYRELL